MKTLIKSLLLLAMVTSPLHAADYEAGVSKLNKGQFHQAIAEFEPLVAEGYAPAQHQMGEIYLNGWGVPKDAGKAFELFTLAAEQNYPDSLFQLSLMYSEGKMTQKDLTTAFKLMERAANKGLVAAKFNLGVMYANGEGVRKNEAKAVWWYEQAANENYVLAQFNLALMYYEGKGVPRDVKMSYFWNLMAAHSGYKDAITSAEMDQRQLNESQIKQVREDVERKRRQIKHQQELKAQRAL
ncbi:sel1 repeat family protein [Thalassotalea sp. LPB0316]|uniref:tetratricopeptide repeat protein n=1 Tax=Thalassotalea sp. LPB0316 TaxID=2769490 RepID=UPI0018681C1A|nr:tetratricopeptide repeat protein [Thalassotalea sp. LPB0316]QOL26605.1 sel1 repeat family protein [Thalassotalea sp. LPB0316]